MTYDEAVDKIHSFYNLKDNWDSYGAPAFDEEDILVGLRCLEYVKEHFNWKNIEEYLFIGPFSGGGVVFQFQDGTSTLLIESNNEDYDNHDIYLNERS